VPVRGCTAASKCQVGEVLIGTGDHFVGRQQQVANRAFRQGSCDVSGVFGVARFSR
jgi:hypothetical protein